MGFAEGGPGAPSGGASRPDDMARLRGAARLRGGRTDGPVVWGRAREGCIIKRKITRLFESRSGGLDYRVRRDYVRNGIVTIPCNISEYSDVICSYSVSGCESLNTDFVDYVKEAAEMTPSECPIVLDLIGGRLTEEEQDSVEETIKDDFAYDLGMVEREERRHAKVFFLMFIGMIVSGIALRFTEPFAEEPRELLWILFWFMGDTLCDYLFLTGHDLRQARRLAGRLASVRVVFSESYQDPTYKEHEVENLYSEIEREVKETRARRGRRSLRLRR